MTRFHELSLKEPRVVVSTPGWIKWLILLAIALFVSFVVISAWNRWSETGSLEVHHVFGAVFAFMFLAVVGSPSYWRTWASFAADSGGVYFADRRGGWHRIPWGRVGDIRIEDRTTGSGGSMRHLVVYTDLTEEERGRLAPLANNLANLAYPSGSTSIPLGLAVVNNFGDLERQKQQIETLRS